MLKIIPVCLFLCLSAVSARAQTPEISADELMQAEFEQNKLKIEEIFQEKIQKITARAALPEDMRRLLISQADEVRQFDTDMLQKKMELKMKQAKERDDVKEMLRQDAHNRAKWLLEDEEKFQKNKAEREAKEAAVLKNNGLEKPAEDDKDAVKSIQDDKKDILSAGENKEMEKSAKNDKTEKESKNERILE